MRCPKCNSTLLAVVDSRADGGAIRRRRRCEACDYRFTTFERLELSLPFVLKKDGRREAFDRQKLKAGILRACEKTSVGVDQIDITIDRIEARIFDLCQKEITSSQIGEFLMDELKKLDQVAYIRFASVYRQFTDVSQFIETLQSLALQSKIKKKSVNTRKVNRD